MADDRNRRFSHRLDWDHRQNRLTTAEADRRRAGDPILDLTESNPTAVGLIDPAQAAALARALGRAGGAAYTPTPRGHPAARRAVADAYARAGTAIDPERLLLTASSSESYSFLWKLLCDPGDAVAIPEPSYPLFDYLARLESVATRPYRLVHDGTAKGTWDLDLASAEEALASPPRPSRALVVVSPNNPTGSVLRSDELGALDSRAAALGAALVADEVFADYVDAPTPSVARPDGRVPRLPEAPTGAPGTRARRVVCVAAEETESLTFSLGGLSKGCGLPQLKLGWIAVGGPAHLATAALERLDLIADTYLSLGTPVQTALPDLLAVGTSIRASIAARVARNRRRLAEAAGRDSPITILGAEGGWTAIVRLPAVRTDEEWALALLEQDGVLCHPGYFFDLRGGTFLVLSLLPAPDSFDAGVHRLRERVADSIR